jgi:hypothetical protein
LVEDIVIFSGIDASISHHEIRFAIITRQNWRKGTPLLAALPPISGGKAAQRGEGSEVFCGQRS